MTKYELLTSSKITVNRHIAENSFWTKCRKWFYVKM